MRTVYDAILHHGSIRSFPINNSLLLSCQLAGTKYKNDLKRKKRFRNSEKNQKGKQLSEKLSIIKMKKVEIEDLVKELDDDADKFVSKAGNEEMKNLVTKANSFKQSAKEKNKAIAELKSTIEKMEVVLNSFDKK